MSNFVIQRNIATGVFIFVPKVFMEKVFAMRIIATFQGFRNESEFQTPLVTYKHKF